MHKKKMMVAALVASLGLAACGSGGVQTAYVVCGSHGGVDEQTWEPDGDVLCLDGYEYEGDGDFEHAGYYKKHRKNTKPKLSAAGKARIQQQVQAFRAKQAAKKKNVSAAPAVKPSKPSFTSKPKKKVKR